MAKDPYETETFDFTNYEEWQDAINDAKVEGVFASCGVYGKNKFWLKVYINND